MTQALSHPNAHNDAVRFGERVEDFLDIVKSCKEAIRDLAGKKILVDHHNDKPYQLTKNPFWLDTFISTEKINRISGFNGYITQHFENYVMAVGEQGGSEMLDKYAQLVSQGIDAAKNYYQNELDSFTRILKGEPKGSGRDTTLIPLSDLHMSKTLSAIEQAQIVRTKLDKLWDAWILLSCGITAPALPAPRNALAAPPQNDFV